MTPFVLDCSVTMAWCFKDECDDYANNVLETLRERDALVPSLWRLEVANVLLVAERQKRLSPADSERFLALVSDLPIAIDEPRGEHDMATFLARGRQYDLTSYDAAYLELAMRQGLPLATRDRRLRDACRVSGTALLEV